MNLMSRQIPSFASLRATSAILLAVLVFANAPVRGATTYTDTATQTTLVNGSLTIVYNKTTGLANYSLGGTARVRNLFSEFSWAGVTYKSKDYTSHTFSTADVATFTDGFGSGTRVTFVNTKAGSPNIRQNFYIYDGKPWFLIDVNVTHSSSVTCNYMSPIRCDSQAVNINGSTDKYVLIVPFDNDTWVRYNAQSVNGSGQGYEALAVYDNTSRNGVVFGSIYHDTWKTALWYWGTGNNLDQLQIYGGVANSSTRDTQSHGSISGTSIWSPKILAGYYADWRDGMEEFGRVNATQSGSMSWSGGVPFGWNSWGALGSGVTYAKVTAIANWIKTNLQSSAFSNNGTVYINLDSYWDSLNDTELANFVSVTHANGQKAGIYWAPFVYWGSDMARTVENSTYTYGNIVLKKYDGTVWGNSLDGAYPLDVTHPGTQDRINYFIDKFKNLGFEYIKLDFLTHGSLEGQHYSSSVTTGIQAYNQGMNYVRNRIAGSMFIDLAISPIFPAQYAHARRISCDVDGSIGKSEYELNSLSYGWWQNGSIYKYTDPDYAQLSSNLEEARSSVNAVAISGTVFLDSNDLTVTSQQNMALSLLRNNNVNGVGRKQKAFRALEGNTGSSAADSFVLNDNGTFYLALFNYSSTSGKSMSISLSRAGLSGMQAYTVANLWSGAISTVTGTLNVTLSASQSQLLRLTAGSALPDGTYKIVARHSGKALEASGTANGSAALQRTYNGGANQQWNLTNLGGGVYSIIGVQSGKALEVAGASTSDGAGIDINPYSGGNHQKWTITNLGTGYYRADAVNSSKSLDVAGGATNDGAGVIQWGWNGGNNQQWSFALP
jgi:alpha-galactosidase